MRKIRMATISVRMVGEGTGPEGERGGKNEGKKGWEEKGSESTLEKL